MNYKRTVSELEKKASTWWPKNLEETVAEKSIIPKLIATQDKFISILKLSGESPNQVFKVLSSANMPANLFLKHLSVLSDYGGEKLQRLGREFEDIFPSSGSSYLFPFLFGGKAVKYTFKALPISNLSNKRLDLDGKSLIKERGIEPLYEDMIMVLLHGATSDVAEKASLDRCEVGTLLGDERGLEKYIKEKYIHVSRITTGASANDLGQIAQTGIVKHLQSNLGEGYEVIRNGKIPLKGLDKPMPFDVVVKRKGQTIGVEVSFQVTTNSTIERKAGQAANRQKLMHKAGCSIAYVLDGAGNFQRAAAMKEICKYSDCTVAYSEKEFNVLVEFIKERLHD